MADSRKPARPKSPSGGKGRPAKGGARPDSRSGSRSDSRSDSRPDSRSGSRPGPKSGGPRRGPAGGTGPRGSARSDAPRPDERARKPKTGDAIQDFLDSDAPRAKFPQPARPAKDSGDSRARSPRKDGDRPDRAPRPGVSFEDKRGAGREGKREDRRDGAPTRPGQEAAPEERADGKTVTAGRNPVRELLETSPRKVDSLHVRKGLRDAKVQEIVALADENKILVRFEDDSVLRRLFPGNHQGVVAVTAAVEYVDLDVLLAAVPGAPLPVVVALDKVQDPGNLGAIARTAYALGAVGLIVPRHGGSYIGSGALRASAGALHHLPVARVTNLSQALDACAEAGLAILCADSSGENLHTAAIDLPAVLVLGGEEKGVRHGVSKHCAKKLAIPLKRAFDSLNVAQAAAICLARLGSLE